MENSSRDEGALSTLPTTESHSLALLSEAPPPAHAFEPSSACTGIATRGIGEGSPGAEVIKAENLRRDDDLTSTRRAQCSTDTQPITEALSHAWRVGGRHKSKVWFGGKVALTF